MSVNTVSDIDEVKPRTTPPSKPSQPAPVAPELRLAHAIAATGLDDVQLARMTYGEVDEQTIKRLRAGNKDLPAWHSITTLLRFCRLTPADIGQPTHSHVQAE